jgi:hypothetical protein
MKVWARINHVGWVHLWLHHEDFERAEPSAHFFNGRSDPRNWSRSMIRASLMRRREVQAGPATAISRRW